MLKITLLKWNIFCNLFQIYLTMEHTLRTTELIEMNGMPLLQEVLHENFLQRRFDGNWKAKSLRLSSVIRTKVKLI